MAAATEQRRRAADEDLVFVAPFDNFEIVFGGGCALAFSWPDRVACALSWFMDEIAMAAFAVLWSLMKGRAGLVKGELGAKRFAQGGVGLSLG